jgi:two-component system response regulator WspF
VRVGIVNDLALAVLALRRLVEGREGAEVAWVAADGEEAVARCVEDTPDLVLMDLVMPNVDGVEATRRIMQKAPCPILVVTATVEGNLSKVYHALGAGALDAVSGPTFGPDGSLQDAEPVLRKMRNLRLLMEPVPCGAVAKRRTSSPPMPPLTEPAARLVVIGASTGGPQAIVDTVAGFGADFRPPLLVVQHLDDAFVPGFCSWLASQTGWPTAAIETDDAPREGEILVAAGSDHLVMGASRRMRYEREPLDVPHRPSVDAFFASLKRSWPTPGVAVLLTGMGHDGARGLLALQDAGWATLAQDEATSVVWGMPRAAKECGAAGGVVPIERMGMRIEREWRRLAEASGEGA